MDTTCVECTNELADTDDRCPRCGAAVRSTADRMPPLMSVLNEPQPAASPSKILLTRVAAIALLGWLCVMAALTWRDYDAGYIDTPLALWNSVFVVGTIPIIVGVFARRMWAQRWAAGIATFTALSHAYHASRSDSTLLWIGALILGGVAIVMHVTKPIFRHDNAHRGTIWQVIATVVTVGSLIMVFGSSHTTGSERGRKAFAAEVQRSVKATVRVYVEDRTLVIEGPSDTDAQIDEAAQLMHNELARNEAPKVWAVGFENVKLTNGRHTRILAPVDPP